MSTGGIRAWVFQLPKTTSFGAHTVLASGLQGKTDTRAQTIRYPLRLRDGVVLEQGTADEVYINRKACELKRNLMAPLFVCIFDERAGEWKTKYQLSAFRFFPLEEKGQPVGAGQWLNADGQTFTKVIETEIPTIYLEL